MSNRHYQRGTQRERDVRDLYLARGYWVACAKGSKGEADVVALKAGFPPKMVEVKATKTPWSGFGPQDRADLLAAAERAGAEPLLCWWPGDRQGPRWYAPETWPSPRTHKIA